MPDLAVTASPLLVVLGGVLVAFALLDAFITVLSTRGGGPLTSFALHGVWRLCLAVHRRWPVHGALIYVGPVLMVAIVLLWYSINGLGWTLVFLGGSHAVVRNQGLEPVDVLDHLYFVGATQSSAGYGDLLPNGFPWTFVSGLTTLTSTLLVTSAVSYVLPVVSAARGRRALAHRIFRLGETPAEIADLCWGPHEHPLDAHVLDLLADLEGYAHRLLVYPVLHCFHAPARDSSLACATLTLADALFVAAHRSETQTQPSARTLTLADRSLRRTVALMQQSVVDAPEDVALPPTAAPQLARHPFVERYAGLRRQLVQMTLEDGWRAEAQTATT